MTVNLYHPPPASTREEWKYEEELNEVREFKALGMWSYFLPLEKGKKCLSLIKPNARDFKISTFRDYGCL